MKIGENETIDAFLSVACFMGAIDKMISDGFGLTNGATKEFYDSFKSTFYDMEDETKY